MSRRFENRSAFLFRIKLSNNPLFYPEDEGTVFCRYPMKYSMTQRQIIAGLNLKYQAEYNAFTHKVRHPRCVQSIN